MAKLWSHRMAQQTDLISADEQEALSRRYGAGILIVLPLESGRLAIFGPDRQLISITEGVPLLEVWQKLSAEGYAKIRAIREALAGPTGSQTVETEEDLGL